MAPSYAMRGADKQILKPDVATETHFTTPNACPTHAHPPQPFNHLANQPRHHPTVQPSSRPAIQPSNQSFIHPTIQPPQPSSHPALQPSSHPTISIQPNNPPAIQPANHPAIQSSSHPSTHPPIQPAKHRLQDLDVQPTWAHGAEIFVQGIGPQHLEAPFVVAVVVAVAAIRSRMPWRCPLLSNATRPHGQQTHYNEDVDPHRRRRGIVRQTRQYQYELWHGKAGAIIASLQLNLFWLRFQMKKAMRHRGG